MSEVSDHHAPFDWVDIFQRVDMTQRSHVKDLLRLLFLSAEAKGELVPKLDVSDLTVKILAHENWRSQQTGSPRAGMGFRRDPKWSAGWSRMLLHSKIVKSLMTKRRPKDEEKISIRNGGSLPAGGAERANTAFIITGPPAAGKSRMAGPLAMRTRSVIVDPDDAKRMLPEYRNGLNTFGLHEESSLITKGPNGVLDCAASDGYNIVLPTIGDNSAKLLKTQKELMSLGYTVYLVNVHCPVEIAAVRSLERMARTGRYVPLGYLLAEVGNSPYEAYRKAKSNGLWAGHAQYDLRQRNKEPQLVGHKRFEKFI